MEKFRRIFTPEEKASPSTLIAKLVSEITGVQFGSQQNLMVDSRLQKRLRALGFTDLSSYLPYLEEHFDREIQELISALTTHHTYFFREFAQFEHLRTMLSSLIHEAQRRGDKKIRIWSAACSRGHEVYSLAMYLDYLMRTDHIHISSGFSGVSFEIYGTDVDANSIEIARNGVYSEEELKDVEPIYLTNHWAKGLGEIAHFSKAKKNLRQFCSFEVVNLMEIPPHIQDHSFDVIFCRNVFIYFNTDQIRTITENLIRSLQPHGLLYVGLSESLSNLVLPIQSTGPSVYTLTKPLPSMSEAISAISRTREASPSPPPPAPAPNPTSITPIPSAPSRGPRTPIRILIVDDSATIRNLLTRIFKEDPELEVVGQLERPSQVAEAIERLRPDVVTLDIHMPEMDGVTLLKRLFPKFPLPYIMVSSISMDEGTLVLDALSYGAVDYIQKPGLHEISLMGPLLIEKVKGASKANLRASTAHSTAHSTSGGGGGLLENHGQIVSLDETRSSIRALARSGQMSSPNHLVAIGSSTGGTEALKVILTCLPEEIPPILITQHIPPVFSKSLALRLNDLCPFEVKEAEDGDSVQPGRVLIAPGATQMVLAPGGHHVRVDPNAPPCNRHKPSVDILFESVAKEVGKTAIGIILTGMGADGAKGLLKMRQTGSHTIAQDEESCVVFGMPREAILLGAAEKVVHLNTIPTHLVRWLTSKAA